VSKIGCSGAWDPSATVRAQETRAGFEIGGLP